MGYNAGVKIFVTGIFVENQEKALSFYTEKLGFVKKQDRPAGEFRWLTVVSPENQNSTELLLEPNSNPVARTYQKGLVEQKIPAVCFGVVDIEKEYERLKNLGVVFTVEPIQDSYGKRAVFDDTCGNLVVIVEQKSL